MTDFLIIGGSNIDYTAISKHPLLAHDSNIGHLKIAFGGVGRNITEDLVLLGDKVNFITAIGNDAQGNNMKHDLCFKGVTVFCPEFNKPSSSYLAVLEPNGQMNVAVCDSSIMEEMNYSDILPFLKTIQSHKHIILEANLSQNVIDGLFGNEPEHKYMVEAVSANKVPKFRSHVHQIDFFKSNYLEAKTFLNKELGKEELVKELLGLGVKKVVITDGGKDIAIGDGNQVELIPVPTLSSFTSESGAGDALFAGTVHEYRKGKSLHDSVLFGIRVSQETMKIPGAVNPEISKLTK